MSDYTPKATITAVDNPSEGWYTALTCFGTSCTGVRVEGQDKKFAVGQEVAVIQIGNEFGFAELGSLKSQLVVPDAVIPQLKNDAPASCALAVVASLAGNRKEYYKASLIESAAGTDVVVDGLNLKSAVDGMRAGDGCLLDAKSKPVACLGFWQSAHTEFTGQVAIMIAREPYGAKVKMSLVQRLDNGTYKTVRYAIVAPSSMQYTNVVFTTLRSTDEHNYFYSYLRFITSDGLQSENRYVRWDKTRIAAQDITSAEWAAQVAVEPDYTLAADDKYWWWSYPTPPEGATDARFCYISDELDSEKIPVFQSGMMSTEGVWLPVKGHIYEEVSL